MPDVLENALTFLCAASIGIGGFILVPSIMLRSFNALPAWCLGIRAGIGMLIFGGTIFYWQDKCQERLVWQNPLKACIAVAILTIGLLMVLGKNSRDAKAYGTVITIAAYSLLYLS